MQVCIHIHIWEPPHKHLIKELYIVLLCGQQSADNEFIQSIMSSSQAIQWWALPILFKSPLGLSQDSSWLWCSEAEQEWSWGPTFISESLLYEAMKIGLSTLIPAVSVLPPVLSGKGGSFQDSRLRSQKGRGTKIFPEVPAWLPKILGFIYSWSRDPVMPSLYLQPANVSVTCFIWHPMSHHCTNNVLNTWCEVRENDTISLSLSSKT